GRGVIGNKAASGTAIITEVGEEHQRTGKWIVYTSADSVFQVAAHEATVPLEELYGACRTARELLIGEHAVSRVIARPFVGRPGCARGRTRARRTGATSRSSPWARRCSTGSRRRGSRGWGSARWMTCSRGGTSRASTRRRMPTPTG